MKHSNRIVSPLAEQGGVIVSPAELRVALDQLTLEEVVPLLKEHGAILFRAFESGIPQFLAFTEKFSTRFSDYRGGAFQAGKRGRQKVNQMDTLMTTTGGDQGFPIPLHGEMYY